MKKFLLWLSIIFIIAVIICIKNIQFGYHLNSKTKTNILIPNMSFLETETEIDDDLYYAEFKSFSSLLLLKSQLSYITKDLDSYYCNNTNYYYQSNDDVTITDYGVKLGFPLNTFYFTYHIGRYFKSECGKIKSAKDLTYSIVPVNETGYCYIDNEFVYLNEDGNEYTVHYNCFGNLAFKNGLDKMEFINSMLSYNWLSMKDIVDFFDYLVKKKKLTRVKFDDNGSFLYKNSDFSFLKCDNGKNKEIYIGPPIFEYEESSCD